MLINSLMNSLLLNNNKEIAEKRLAITFSWSEYKWPLAFLLSMSMIGLWFPIGFVAVPLLLINRFRNNRYDFLIMLVIWLGGFGFTAEGTYPVKTFDVALLLSAILIIVYKNRGIVKKSVITWLAFCSGIFIISLFSEESLAIQFRLMRYTFLFSCFIIPIVCFSSRNFDIKVFFSSLMPYIIIILAFYILDGLVVCGFIFLPRTPLYGNIPDSFFYSPIVYGFPYFMRKYPQALILLSLVIYPIARFYKMNWWFMLMFIGASVACQTFTVLSGFVVGYIVSILKLRSIIKYIIGIAVLFTCIYFIDGLLPESKNESGNESFLRVKSSIDQIISIAEINDDIDLAALGSGRVGQALPKLELVNALDKEMTGLGFLHPTLTTNPKYIIDNEYYLNVENSEEVATKLIENELLQIFVTTGWMGLMCYFIFFPLTYFYVRKFEYGRYYMSVLVMIFWFGMGAYGGLTAGDGLIILSLAYGVTLLSGRKDREWA